MTHKNIADLKYNVPTIKEHLIVDRRLVILNPLNAELVPPIKPAERETLENNIHNNGLQSRIKCKTIIGQDKITYYMPVDGNNRAACYHSLAAKYPKDTRYDTMDIDIVKPLTKQDEINFIKTCATNCRNLSRVQIRLVAKAGIDKEEIKSKPKRINTKSNSKEGRFNHVESLGIVTSKILKDMSYYNRSKDYELLFHQVKEYHNQLGRAIKEFDKNKKLKLVS